MACKTAAELGLRACEEGAAAAARVQEYAYTHCPSTVAEKIPTLHDLKVRLPTQHRRDAQHNKVHHLATTQVFLTQVYVAPTLTPTPRLALSMSSVSWTLLGLGSYSIDA